MHPFPSLLASKDLTDCDLLALAIQHGARPATGDCRTDPALLAGGPAAFPGTGEIGLG